MIREYTMKLRLSLDMAGLEGSWKSKTSLDLTKISEHFVLFSVLSSRCPFAERQIFNATEQKKGNYWKSSIFQQVLSDILKNIIL